MLVRMALNRWIAEPLTRENEHLQEVAQAKSDLVNIVSHELRTPIASIIAFTNLWEKSEQGDRNPEKEHELVGAIRQNSETLLEMVNNTIDIARIEAGRFELAEEQVDVDEVAGAIASVAKPIAFEKGLAFSCKADEDVPVVVSDWEALRKILTNLVGNALKYTDQGKVELSVRYESESEMLVMEVRDTGIGIDSEDLESIFETFSQGKDAPRGNKRNGSGLGLSLVRNLSSLMGGDVNVESSPGVGYGCIAAQDGIDAVRAAQEEHPDLIVLDVMMPGLDGFEVIERVRAFDQDVPILMLSAKADIVDKRIGFRLGADGYMVKPFNEEELLLHIEALLRRRDINARNEARRVDPTGPAQTTAGGLSLDLIHRRVTLDGREVSLTPKEFDILATFASEPDKPFTPNELISLIWGPDYTNDSISIPVYIRRLRKKIEEDPSSPRYIQTIHQVGYRFIAQG